MNKNTKQQTPAQTGGTHHEGYMIFKRLTGYSWAKVAKIAAQCFGGKVPPTTLSRYARTGKHPLKHRRALGIGWKPKKITIQNRTPAQLRAAIENRR